MQTSGSRGASSSSSSSSSSKPNEAGLEFVLVDQPTKRATGDVRKRVRSHVTKLQHQRNREKEVESQASASRFISYEEQAAKQRPPGRKAAKVVKARKAKVTHVDKASAEKALANRQPADDAGDQASDRQDVDDTVISAVAAEHHANSGAFARTKLGTAFSRGTLSFRTFALDDATNTVGSSLEALGLDVASVLGCYGLIVTIQAKDFEDNYCKDQLLPRVNLRERFYGFIFSDPVLLTVALLLTIRYRLECLGYRDRMRDFMQVLNLEDFLIKRVNTALKQPGRATSDQLLVAVALCAAYEVKNGNPAAYHIHMKGLMRMIEMRGGLEAIGRDDPYLERMLIWHDVNTSQILGHEGYLYHMPHSLKNQRPQSNLATFRRPIETDAQSSSSSSSATAGPRVQEVHE